MSSPFIAANSVPERLTAPLRLFLYLFQELMTQTAGKCKFIEGAFEETFTADTLNYTRWKDNSIHGGAPRLNPPDILRLRFEMRQDSSERCPRGMGNSRSAVFATPSLSPPCEGVFAA